MKIYDKKLSSLQDLRKERLRLKNRLEGVGSADKTDQESSKENFLSGLLSGVTSGSVLTTVLNVAPTILDIIKNRSLPKATKTQQVFTSQEKEKNIIANILTDFIGGYIKWKILELSYKGLRKALKSKKVQFLKNKAASKIQKPFKK